jgi:hypothetical protein
MECIPSFCFIVEMCFVLVYVCAMRMGLGIGVSLI